MKMETDAKFAAASPSSSKNRWRMSYSACCLTLGEKIFTSVSRRGKLQDAPPQDRVSRPSRRLHHVDPHSCARVGTRPNTLDTQQRTHRRREERRRTRVVRTRTLRVHTRVSLTATVTPAPHTLALSRVLRYPHVDKRSLLGACPLTDRTLAEQRSLLSACPPGPARSHPHTHIARRARAARM